MSFKFIANACGVFLGKDGTSLLCDPWLVDGVFEGSWCHWPPLKTTFADVADVDAIYLSHIHPDHFDERNFDFRRDVPIVILDRDHNFLERRLNDLGFTKIIKAREGETIRFREFHLTLWGPFVTHNFHEASVGNVIDSAIVVESEGYRVLNANDNTPTPDACRDLRQRFGELDLAMINYNAAGPYPAAFDNLTEDEKLAEHSRILDRNMDYMLTLLDELRPRAVLPFAGAYVLGGYLWEKNRFLGTTTWDACADYLVEHGSPCEVITMREGTSLDLASLQTDRPYVRLDLAACERYIKTELAQRTYDYEMDELPETAQIIVDLERAVGKMLDRSRALGLHTNFSASVASAGEEYLILPHFSEKPLPSSHHLRCSLDSRLLRRILDRRAQWNSSEIGCHISFNRSPNVYEPDLHTMLQFLHL